MPSITITINTPVLTGSDYFKTRYRLLPNPFSGGYSNRTNAPFALSGLAVGEYELEVIMVKNGVECAAKIFPFEIVPEYTCATFTPQIIQNGTLFNLRLTYPALVNPPCGWHISVVGTANNKTVNYNPLPTSPLDIPIVNEAINVRVTADLCNDKVMQCLNTNMTAIIPTCTPMVVSGVLMSYNSTYANGFLGINVAFSVTNSVPASKTVQIYIQQLNVLSGQPGSYSNTAFPVVFTGVGSLIPVLVMNNNVFNSKYDISWVVIDGCGVKHSGTASLQL